MSQAQENNDDFWLLLDYEAATRNVVWLYTGADESDGNYYGVTADLVIFEPVFFNLSATKQNYSTQSTDLSWGFSGVIDDVFSWGISKAFWGEKETLEKDDVRLRLGYLNGGFSTQASYEEGEIKLFLIDSMILQRDSIITDHRAFQLSLAYHWTQIYGQISHKHHNYNKDLFLLSRAPRLRFIFKPVSVQQASALAETESSVLLGFQASDTSYEAHLSRIKSAVTTDINTYATLRLIKELNSQLQLGFEVELPVDDVPFGAGVSLGLMW